MKKYKEYEQSIFEIIYILQDDVICCSGGENMEDENGENQGQGS